MKGNFLKAKARKKKFIKRKEKIIDEDDSDGELSSDDEELYSQNIVGKLVNNKYLILKYLGRGTFSKVWLVLNILKNKYYALKIQDHKYTDDIIEEINIIKHIQKEINVEKEENFNEYNYGILIESFNIKINDESCICLILELLGPSVGLICDEDYDNLLNINMIKRIIYKIVTGIKSIHDSDILHNDLKPDNILFTELSPTIKEYISKINNLNIDHIYNRLIEDNTPKQVNMLPKNKRKMIKKKIKIKCAKELIKELYSKIEEINKDNNTSNLELKIENKENNEEEEFENEDNIYNLLECNLKNINVKIIDFGNSEYEKDKKQDEIYTRCYRPPENIINNEYSKKSDIWFVGCFLYELLTGEIMFELNCNNNSDFYKDRKHINLMYSYLGKIPREMSMNCEFSEDIFDSKGRIIDNKKYENINLRAKLNKRIKIEEDELDLIEDLIFKILEYNPKQRLSADKILEHKWFKNID
tara:strand:+ start:505 stop:1926 length:1422 start_codon:yes stop_codon:yes gene_type:complete